jgi:hypothetical protein
VYQATLDVVGEVDGEEETHGAPTRAGQARRLNEG